MFKRRLQRYFLDKGVVKDLSGFTASLFPIDTLETLRNTLAYVNRNGYLVDARYTPFSYPWGANRFFFQPDISHLQGTRYEDLTFREKRRLFRSHAIDYPNTHLVMDGYVLPASFCALGLAESMFQSARQYFFLLSRNVEAYRSIASQLGDLVFYTDDELFLVVRQLCKDAYGTSRPSTLSKEAKGILPERCTSTTRQETNKSKECCDWKSAKSSRSLENRIPGAKTLHFAPETRKIRSPGAEKAPSAPGLRFRPSRQPCPCPG